MYSLTSLQLVIRLFDTLKLVFVYSVIQCQKHVALSFHLLFYVVSLPIAVSISSTCTVLAL